MCDSVHVQTLRVTSSTRTHRPQENCVSPSESAHRHPWRVSMGKAILMGQVLSGGIHFVCPSLWSTRTHVQTEIGGGETQSKTRHDMTSPCVLPTRRHTPVGMLANCPSCNIWFLGLLEVLQGSMVFGHHTARPNGNVSPCSRLSMHEQ